jgi:hypothetical protein
MYKYVFLPTRQLYCYFSYHTSKSCGNSRTKLPSYDLFQQYVARPHTLLYLAVEYSVTRCKFPVVPSSNMRLTEFLVYANSILAMYEEGSSVRIPFDYFPKGSMHGIRLPSA